MTRKVKGRTDWHLATPKTSKHAIHSTAFYTRIKAVIATLALWGWLPMWLATWINNHRETRDD